MWRTPPDFGTWITSANEAQLRHFDRPPESPAHEVAPAEPRKPLSRADVERIWERVILVGRRQG